MGNFDDSKMIFKKGKIFKVTTKLLSVLDKQDRITIKNIIKGCKTDYVLCIKNIDSDHLLCTLAYLGKDSKDFEKGNQEYIKVRVKPKSVFNVNIKCLEETEIIFEDIHQISSVAIDSYNKKILKINKKKENNNKQKKKNNRHAKKTTNKINPRLKKKIQAKIRERAMNDPRYYADEGVVKVDSRGSGSSYRTAKSNQWRNVNKPISAGRGNF